MGRPVKASREEEEEEEGPCSSPCRGTRLPWKFFYF